MASILKPGGLDKLNSYVAPKITPLRPGEVPQVYSGSTPGAPTQRDYTQPIGQYVPNPHDAPGYDPAKDPTSSVYKRNQQMNAFQGALSPQQERINYENQFRIAPTTSTPFSTPTNPFSNAFNALKSFASNTYNKLNQGLAGGTNLAAVSQFPQPNATSTTATTSAPITQTAPPQSQVKSKIGEQYTTITNDTASDSSTMQKNLDVIKQQDTAEKQGQLMSLQNELASKQAQLAALQAGEQPTETTLTEGQPTTTYAYNPEGQSQISTLSAQIKAMEEEIARVQQDSPELQAATQAIQKKIAEEAMIKANLTQGVANVQDQPIAQGFISGQSAALERQAQAKLQTNAAQRIPLQQQLATEQAKKQTAIDVVKTKYGGLADERGRLEDIYKTNYQRANTVVDRNYQLKGGTTTTTAGLNTGKTFVSGNLKYANDDYNEDRNTLLSTSIRDAQGNPNRGTDGYTNPSIYLDLYRQWIANGGLKSDFLQVYPIKDYINPQNNWPEIVALGGGTKPKTTTTKSTSTSSRSI